MPHLIVRTPAGDETTVSAAPGASVMEVIRDHGFDDLLALCGGCCACATCHVYIAPNQMDWLEPMTEEEADLLEIALHRRPESRLSCQLTFTEALSGLRVTIAPEN